MYQMEQVLVKDHLPQLGEISDPPKTLWIRGNLPPAGQKFLAVVGSRRHSSYGKEVCEKLIAGLTGHPISIISGLALGIDSIAHRSALNASLHTIAVPGSGLNDGVLYPRTHLGLAHEILKSGGALLSEFEPDMRATPYTFPQRNRIMAGLAHAVLLVEAGERSGTLITARLTSEFNRELLVVPGSIFSPNSAGVHQFLKLGATPITTSADILQALGFDIEAGNTISHEDLSDDERAVVELLSVEPLDRDQLIAKLGKNASEVSILLSTL